MAKGQDESTFVIWLDNALLLLGGFVLMTAILLTSISKPLVEEVDGVKNPGNIAVTIVWKSGIDADVDTWLQSPHDDAVGYSNLSGTVWNLLRDDLGSPNDMGGLNMENAYSRGIPAGEYAINVHAYRANKSLYPIEIEVEVIVVKDPKAGKGGQKKFKRKATLYKTGEEITVMRFTVDGEKNIIEDSINAIFTPIRNRR